MLLAALATAERALPLYSHRNSPKTFTQHQLFACLVLKNFLKTDYRGVVAHLADCPSLAETLRLARVPHYTTLQKAARRLLSSVPAKRLLDATVRQHLGRKRCVPRTAIDSTGLESSAASGYFVHRRRYVGGPWKTVIYHRFPKLGIVCDVRTHFILAAQEGRGPRPDVADFRPLLAAALARVRMGRIAADAGFDSEPNHAFARRECRVRSIIPAKHGRPTTKPATGHYRRLMQTRFDEVAYRDRIQVETVISMVKRRLEAFVRGRTSWSQRRDLWLKVLTHNVMILLHIEVFYRAWRIPFLMQYLVRIGLRPRP
ncbi:MAG TPA: transposase [Lacipirellulaceae bacterium]